MRRGVQCFAVALGIVTGGAVVKKVWLKKYRRLEGELQNSEREQELLYTWLRLELSGKQLTEYFSAHGYQRVAVFGMGRIGRLVADALGDMAVYAVEENNFGAVHERLTVYRWGEDPLPPADCMVICDLAATPEQLAGNTKTFSRGVVALRQVLDGIFEHSK